MGQFDILFWLLVALLGGVAFAIEAGAASRHRKVVLCTLFSVAASVLYMMFMVDDKTTFGTMAIVEPTKKDKKGAAQAGPNAAGGDKADAELQRNGKAGDGDGDGEDGDGKSGRAGADKKDAHPDTLLEPVFAECEFCPSMVRIKPGELAMGAPMDEPGRRSSEGPVRKIRFTREFSVGRFEITRKEFGQFVKATGYTPTQGCVPGSGNGKLNPKLNWRSPGFEQSGAHPAVCITEKDAQAYVDWISQETKRSYRLLSESEWEYMARGGQTTIYSFGDEVRAGTGNYNRQRDGTTPVGFSGANEYGVYEAHGNAAEMVAGCWSEDLKPIPSSGVAYESPDKCRLGVIRGGGWVSPLAEADPTVGYNWVGFRIARDMMRGRQPSGYAGKTVIKMPADDEIE
jgi:formylglycine-generating enzyme required for sulfatase activity